MTSRNSNKNHISKLTCNLASLLCLLALTDSALVRLSFAQHCASGVSSSLSMSDGSPMSGCLAQRVL